MLKVSLPAFLKREQKAPQSLPSENFIDSLNLLEDTSFVAPDTSLKKIVKSMQIAIGVTCVIYLVLSVANLLMDVRLNAAKVDLDSAYEAAAVYKEDAAAIQEIDRKTAFYKNIQNSRSLVGEKSSVLFEELGGTMSVVSSSLTPQSFKITLEGSSPLDFAKLLNKYLESGLVESISIKSAELQRSKNNYKVDFEGVFK